MTKPKAENPPVAIVTGAGSGIGRATALALSGAGYRLALFGRREEPLRETESLLESHAMVIAGDIAKRRDAQSMVDQAHKHFGRLDVLVNNAGLAPLKPVAEHDADLIKRVFRTNSIGPAIAIARAWPIFVEQRGGCIVNLSSMATADPFPGFFAYAASKAAVNLLAMSCAKEGAEHGIRAFAVAPGAVETGMLRAIADEAMIPREACLAPEAVARVITECVLGSRDAENGATIYMPGP